MGDRQVIATQSELREILEISEEHFFSHGLRNVEQLCEAYEEACDEHGLVPDYGNATLERLGLRLGMIAEASHDGGGLIPYCVWTHINRCAPLIAAPGESTHAAILRQINAERLVAQAERNRESMENR